MLTAVTGSSIAITSERDKDKYNVPKEVVEGFNGSEVLCCMIPFPNTFS